MADGPTGSDIPAEPEWMEDREVFSQDVVEQDGRRGKGPIYVAEQAKRRWRANKSNPKTFTPERAVEMLGYFSEGALIKDVCEAVGISRQTLQGWKDRASEREDGPTNYKGKSTEELRAFVEVMGRRRALRRVEAVARIRRAGAAGTWQAEAWYLERSDPENWRQRNSVIAENPDGSPASPPKLEVTLFEGADATTPIETLPPKADG
jgi:hypothetical protein